MRIATVNVEFGGYYMYGKSKFAFVDRYVKIVNDNKIDVVCFQEAVLYAMKPPVDVTKLIAGKLGYSHVANRKAQISIISRWPLTVLSPTGFNFLLCRCNNVVVANVHLNDQPNTYYSLLGKPYGGTPLQVTEKQAVDLSWESKSEDIGQLLKAVGRSPAIICGDFNELSHLDSLPWKVSRAFYAKRFTDVIRYFKPDCRKHPLYTCDVQRKETKGNPAMRIDMMYYRGVTPKSVRYLTGLKLANQYMSDHIPVVGSFDTVANG